MCKETIIACNKNGVLCKIENEKQRKEGVQGGGNREH